MTADQLGKQVTGLLPSGSCVRHCAVLTGELRPPYNVPQVLAGGHG